jgi:tetratricopeptide (TPR) repeat protein
MTLSPVDTVPEEGNLGEVTVPQLLAHAWRDQRSATLQLSHGQIERHIHVHAGSPVAAESMQDDEDFALLLEGAGLIQTADRVKLEAFARKRKCPQASAVLALRMLDAKELYKAIRMSTRAQLGEVFEWQTGFYRWATATENDSSKAKPYDILSLIQQQLPTRWGSDRLIQSLMPHIECCGDISPRFRRVARKLSAAGHSAQQAIDHLDGSRSLGQVLGEAARDPLAAATLWTVLHAGILRIGDKRVAHESHAMNLEFEFEGANRTTLAKRSSGGDSDPKNLKARPAAIAKADALQMEIAGLLAQISQLNHYSALGLTTEATAGEIKRAYFKAAKKFHPDALARLGLNDERARAARVFGRIAEAFETLSDESKRAAYDAGGSDEPEIDTARLAQAETSFRKGEILVRMGNFLGALEYLEPAVDLWPEEPAYQCTLGWALYKQPTPNLQRAKEHLDTACSQAPNDAVVLFRLGVVVRALGETEEAEALIARARAIEPSVDE